MQQQAHGLLRTSSTCSLFGPACSQLLLCSKPAAQPGVATATTAQLASTPLDAAPPFHLLDCTDAAPAALHWSQAATTEGYDWHTAEQPAMAAAAMRPIHLWCLLLLLTGASHHITTQALNSSSGHTGVVGHSSTDVPVAVA